MKPPAHHPACSRRRSPAQHVVQRWSLQRVIRTLLILSIGLLLWQSQTTSAQVPPVGPTLAQVNGIDGGRNTIERPTPPRTPTPESAREAPTVPGDQPRPMQPIRIDNPVQVMQDAADAMPGFEGGISGSLNIMILLTVLSLAPAIVILTTSFVRIIVVLALLRQAIGTATLPPSQVITGLALFLTFLVMAPTAKKVHEQAIVPMNEGQIDQLVAWSRAKQPLREFMFAQIERSNNWGDVYMVLNYRGYDTAPEAELTRGDVDMLTLVPAFILSELKTAFLIGFRVYLPFLIIDMVISSLLISMGMLMLPPVLISLPFKLLLFVLVDGWRLVVGNLLNSFSAPGVAGPG